MFGFLKMKFQNAFKNEHTTPKQSQYHKNLLIKICQKQSKVSDNGIVMRLMPKIEPDAQGTEHHTHKM